MRRLLWIGHLPSISANSIAALQSRGVDIVHVEYWEQISEFSISSNEVRSALFSGIPEDLFDSLVFSSNPSYACRPTANDEFCEFLEGEWQASLHSYMGLSKIRVINRRALQFSASHGYSGTAFAGRLAKLGWKFSSLNHEAGVDQYILLKHWKIFGEENTIRQLREGHQELLRVTWKYLGEIGCDYMFLGVNRSAELSLRISEVSILPPKGLNDSLIEELMHDL